MKDVTEFIRNSLENSVQGLCKLVEIPSVSAQPKRAQEVRRCAEALVKEFKDLGVDTAQLCETAGHPIVFAQKIEDPKLPTVLIYGHYDVQPEDPVELWDSPPFEPTVRNGALFARGSTDNKGQFYIHMKAAEAFLRVNRKLPVNVKFLIEGEEEVSSLHLPEFIEQQAEQLACDVVMVSDTPMFAHNVPSIAFSLRGLVYVQVDVYGPKQDLHSGNFGGSVCNPANALAQMIASLKDQHGVVQVPGFYDDVRSLSDDERENFRELPFDEPAFQDFLGVEALAGETGFSTLERLWVRPTLDVCGLSSGYQGDGAKTIIPSHAMAKISARLVPNQDHEKIFKQLKQHILELKPPGVRVEVTDLHGGPPFFTPIDMPAMLAAKKAVAAAWRKEPLFTGIGGSIPIVEVMATKLDAPCILMGIGVPDENLHSPNEHLHLDHFEKGILASAHFMNEIAKISKP